MSNTRKVVLTFKASRPLAPADLAHVDRVVNRVIDRAGRVVQAEVSEEAVANLAAELPDWSAQPEIVYQVPDTRKFVRNPPSENPRG